MYSGIGWSVSSLTSGGGGSSAGRVFGGSGAIFFALFGWDALAYASVSSKNFVGFVCLVERLILQKVVVVEA